MSSSTAATRSRLTPARPTFGKSLKSGRSRPLASYPKALVKKRGISGPIQDVFIEHPVLMVHGTSTNRAKAATQMLDDIVNRLISTGDGSGVLRHRL